MQARHRNAGASSGRRPRRGASGAGLPALGLTALMALGAGCDSGAAVPAPVEVIAVEASFGGSWCRRIEDPTTVGALTASRSALDGGWRPAWTPLPPPSLELVFLGASGELGRLGIGDGQAQTTAEDRQVFQPIDDSTAARLVALAGGPPLGPPDRPCASSARPATRGPAPAVPAAALPAAAPQN